MRDPIKEVPQILHVYVCVHRLWALGISFVSSCFEQVFVLVMVGFYLKKKSHKFKSHDDHTLVCKTEVEGIQIQTFFLNGQAHHHKSDL